MLLLECTVTAVKIIYTAKQCSYKNRQITFNPSVNNEINPLQEASITTLKKKNKTQA